MADDDWLQIVYNLSRSFDRWPSDGLSKQTPSQG